MKPFPLMMAVCAAFTWAILTFALPDDNPFALRLLGSLGWFAVFCGDMSKATK